MESTRRRVEGINIRTTLSEDVESAPTRLDWCRICRKRIAGHLPFTFTCNEQCESKWKELQRDCQTRLSEGVAFPIDINTGNPIDTRHQICSEEEGGGSKGEIPINIGNHNKSNFLPDVGTVSFAKKFDDVFMKNVNYYT